MIKWIVGLSLMLFAVPIEAQSFDQIKIENAKLKREISALKKQLADEKPCVAPDATSSPKPKTADAASMNATDAHPNVKGWKKLKWGMSRKKVGKKYRLKAGTSPNYFYSTKTMRVAGEKALFGASFAGDKLSYVQLRFSKTHFNNNMYIEDYDRIQTLLTKKYGEPKKDVFWSKDLYRDNPKSYGTALALGHLSMFSTWKLAHTTITLQVTGNNAKVSHVLMYQSNELKKAQKKASENEALEDL